MSEVTRISFLPRMHKFSLSVGRVLFAVAYCAAELIWLVAVLTAKLVYRSFMKVFGIIVGFLFVAWVMSFNPTTAEWAYSFFMDVANFLARLAQAIIA